MRLGHGLALTGAALLGGVVRPEILWDFANPAAPLPGFSLTRATTGTLRAQDGSIPTAAINEPRYDWTGGTRALLVEPSATNLALNSGDMSGWVEVSTPTTITRPAEPNPFGVGPVSAWAKTDAGNALAARATTASVVAGATYSIWVIAKAGVTNYLQLLGSGTPFGLNVWANFNLSTGAIGSVGPGVIGAPKATHLGGGWYLCEIMGTATATVAGNALVVAMIGSMDAVRAASVTGQTGVKLCHAQLEQSARTSPIVTGASAVTRAADSIASLAMSAIWAAAGSVQGTVVVDVEAGAPNSTARGYGFNISDVGNNALNLRLYALGNIDDRATLFTGDGVSGSSMGIVSALRGRQKIAVSYANGAQPMVSRNGGAPQTHPLVYAHNPANTALQNLFGAFNGRVRSLAVYRNAASAAQLQALSVAA